MSEMTPERLREIAELLERYEPDNPPPVESPSKDLCEWASDLEGRTQPTRDEIELDVAAGFGHLMEDADDSQLAAAAVDALIARGWLGVSDTPNEGDANE